MIGNGWRAFWLVAGAAAVVTAVVLPFAALPFLHGPLPAHTDFSGRATGSGPAASLFVFSGIALFDGLVLGGVFAWDRDGKRFPAAFWFFIAVALWWLVSAQAGFVAAGLHISTIPWGAVNGAFVALFALGVVLLLIDGLRKLYRPD